MRYSQIVKRFTLAALIAFSGAMLTGCGEDKAAEEAKEAAEKVDPNIEAVKNAVFEKFDKSRTLGEALTANLENLQWKSYKNEASQQIVEVTGTWKSGSLSRKRSAVYGNLQLYYVNAGNKVLARFTVNKDQSVELVFGKVESDKIDLGYINDQFPDELTMTDIITFPEGHYSLNDLLEVIFFVPKQK